MNYSLALKVGSEAGDQNPFKLFPGEMEILK